MKTKHLIDITNKTERTTSASTVNNILRGWMNGRTATRCALMLFRLLLLLFDVCFSNRGNWQSSFFFQIFLMFKYFSYPYCCEMSVRCMISVSSNNVFIQRISFWRDIAWKLSNEFVEFQRWFISSGKTANHLLFLHFPLSVSVIKVISSRERVHKDQTRDSYK